MFGGAYQGGDLDWRENGRVEEEREKAGERGGGGGLLAWLCSMDKGMR